MKLALVCDKKKRDGAVKEIERSALDILEDGNAYSTTELLGKMIDDGTSYAEAYELIDNWSPPLRRALLMRVADGELAVDDHWKWVMTPGQIARYRKAHS